MSRLQRPQGRWRPADLLLWMNDLASRHLFGSITWDPPNINATTTTDTTLSDLTVYPEIKGLRTGMPVFVTPPAALNADLIVGACWIPADDQLTIRLRNTSALAVNQASDTWTFWSWIL